jgi:MT0933-like antitoxin protein
MSLIKKLVVLGAAAEAVRRYAKQNPEQVREFGDKAVQFIDKAFRYVDRGAQFVDKAVQFADERTQGKCTGHIDQAKRAVGEFVASAPSLVSARAK